MSSAMSQMRRLDELEAHYAVKKRELDALQKDIAERQAALELRATSVAETATDSAAALERDDKLKKSAAPAVGRCSVVMQALSSRDYLETLPLYEAHNASSALRAAIDCEHQAAAVLRREIAALTTEYEQTTVRAQKAERELGAFERETGWSTNPASMAAINNNKKMQPRSGSKSSGAAADSGTAAAADSARSLGGSSVRQQQQQPETEAMRGERQKKEAADAYILQMKKVEEHHKASRLLQKKLEASLRELDRAGTVQHETEMQVDQQRNRALVLDRDIAFKQAELRDLRARQAECDTEMAAIDRRREQEKELLAQIHGQYRKVKGEAMDVGEQRRQWEETIKAQDRRLAELRERTAMVDQAIDAHGMKADVARFVEEATARRQAQREGPQPAADLTDIIAHYADVNMLAPAEETIPRGIVMLLTSLHDRAAHRVRCKAVLLEEKKAAAEALCVRVQQLAGEHDSSEDRLYAARVECEREVDDNVQSAKAAMVDLREEYAAVKNVSLTVQRKQRHDSIKRGSKPLPEMQFKDKKK